LDLNDVDTEFGPGPMSLVGFGYFVTVMAICKLLIRLTATHVKLWAIVNLADTVMYHPDLDS